MNDIETLQEKLNTVNAQREKLRKEAVEATGELIKEKAKAVFAEFPKVESFSWTQYTPYFCDGETCYFGVNSYDIDINEDPSWDAEKASLISKAGIGQLEDIIEEFDKDDMEDLFGDHVKVTISRNGIEVSEYDHD